MPARSFDIGSVRCGYCGEPLMCNGAGVEAWHSEGRFFCNEYCADAISDERASIEAARPWNPPN